MKIIILTILTLTLISCEHRNPIEKTLIANPGEYWKYYTSDNIDNYNFYKFKPKHLCYSYNKGENYKFSINPSGILMDEQPTKWSVTADSIMTFWNFKYDVVSYNDNVVVLLALSKEKPYTRYIFLIKEDEKHPTRWVNDFDVKRTYNPEKYLLPK